MDSVAALRALSLATEHFRRAVAAHFELSVSDTIAMSHLSAAGEMTPGELAQELGLTPGSVTALLDRLDAAELTERRRHVSDRRKTIVGLTPRGERALSTVQGWMHDALLGLEDGELAEMAGLLNQVAARLHQQTEVINSTTRGGRPHRRVVSAQ